MIAFFTLESYLSCFLPIKISLNVYFAPGTKGRALRVVVVSFIYITNNVHKLHYIRFYYNNNYYLPVRVNPSPAECLYWNTPLSIFF